MMEPTDRNMSTRVMPQVISVLLRPNDLARSLTVSETVKKSKASQVYYITGVSQLTKPAVHLAESPYPCDEGNHEEGPLARLDHAKKGEGIWRFCHWGLEAGEARRQILGCRHAMMRRVVLLQEGATMVVVIRGVNSRFLHISGGHIVTPLATKSEIQLVASKNCLTLGQVRDGGSVPDNCFFGTQIRKGLLTLKQ
jgi:hypothetical protein